MPARAGATKDERARALPTGVWAVSTRWYATGRASKTTHMATWNEGLGGNLITASVLAVGVLVLRQLAPRVGSGIGSWAVSGLQLFAEAEFEMQDGIISKLAEQAVGQLLKTMPVGGADQDPRHAREIMHRFEHKARAQSDRHGWHDRDKRARYRHHVRKLKQAVAQASRDLPPQQRAYLSQASATLSEDW